MTFGRIIRQFSIPGTNARDTLAVQPGFLWYQTAPGPLYLLDPRKSTSSAHVRRLVDVGRSQNQGIARDVMNRGIWIANFGNNDITLFDPWRGRVIRRISVSGTPRGLASDDRVLWMTDVVADTISAVDPRNGRILRSFPSPGGDVQAVEVVPGHLLGVPLPRVLVAVDNGTDTICVLDPRDGAIIKAAPAPSDLPFGLSFNGRTLWVTDSSQVLFEVELT